MGKAIEAVGQEVLQVHQNGVGRERNLTELGTLGGEVEKRKDQTKRAHKDVEVDVQQCF